MQYKPEGLLSSSKEIKLNELHELIESKEVLEGTVEKFTNNSLIVQIDNSNIKGIIDISEFEDSKKETKQISMMSMVGKKIQFIVSSADDNTVKLSRKQAQQMYKQYIKEKLHKGCIIDAIVLDATNTEVYIDIGCGCKAVIYREDISMVRLVDARNYFYKGQRISVVIKDINDRGVLATHKELLGTFEENVEYYELKNDDTVVGKIQRISKHGIYVSIGQNIVGLAESTDLSKLTKPSVGDAVAVHIKSILPQKVKVKLNIVGKATKTKNEKPHYFIRKGNIRVWRYSPENAIKIIESRFE